MSAGRAAHQAAVCRRPRARLTSGRPQRGPMAPAAARLARAPPTTARQDDPGRERVEGQRGAERGRGAASADDGDVGGHRRDGEGAGQVGAGAGARGRCAAAAEPLARSMPRVAAPGAQPSVRATLAAPGLRSPACEMSPAPTRLADQAGARNAAERKGRRESDQGDAR